MNVNVRIQDDPPEKAKQTMIYLPEALKLRLGKYLLEQEQLRRSRTKLICEAIEEWLTRRGY